MIHTPSLLPPNASQGLKNIEQTTARFGDLPVDIDQMMNPDSNPAHLLGWLAWAFSVENWDPSWGDNVKREVIKTSIEVHRRKGTVRAIKDALAAAGYGDATLDETVTGEPWAVYNIKLTKPMTRERAQILRRILSAVAPARCHLKELTFSRVAHLHNGKIRRDGTYTRGAV